VATLLGTGLISFFIVIFTLGMLILTLMVVRLDCELGRTDGYIGDLLIVLLASVGITLLGMVGILFALRGRKVALRRSSGDRHSFLSAWAQRLRRVVARGLIADETKWRIALGRGKILPHIEAINGPRVAGLRIGVGKDADRVISFLEKHKYAMLRQTIPDEREHPEAVNLITEPTVGWYGAKYVVYVPWNDRLAEKDIQTQTLLTERLAKQIAGTGTEWIAGLEENYAPVLLSMLSDRGAQHYFAVGATGAGKSWFVRSAIAQLAMSPNNKFVLIDVSEKQGEGFGEVIPNFSNLIGPVALDMDTARAALIWLREEMTRRFAIRKQASRIIVWIDELPSLKDDEQCVALVKSLVTKGRACDYHIIMCSQHITEETLGKFAGLIKANVMGRAAFAIGTLAGSVESIYDSRARHLLVPGDCYVRHPNMPATRIQASYFPDSFLKSYWQLGPPMLKEWPHIEFKESGSYAGNGFTAEQVSTAVQIRLAGRRAKQVKGYGRTIIQAETGVNQYQSTKLVEFADQILNKLMQIKIGSRK